MTNRHAAAIPFILVTLLIDVLGIGLLIPVLPELVTELAGGNLSTGSAYYGWFIAVYAAMQFVFAPVLGGLADRFGRRPVLLLSLFGSAADYLVMALAPNLVILFIGRVVSGITGANITAANAYIADVSSPAERAKNFGLVGATFGVGFIVGPALGGILAGIGIRAPFYAAAGLALLNWLYGYFILPESLAPENRRPFSWGRANPLGSLRSIGRHLLVRDLTFTYVCIGIAHNAMVATWVLFTTYRFGWTPVINGLSLALVGALSVLVQGVLVRSLVPRLGERRTMLVGIAASALSYVVYGASPYGWVLYVGILIGSIGGLTGPAAQSLISQAVAANEQGEVQGALASLLSLTGVVGPLAGTMLFAYFTGGSAAIVLPGAPYFLGSGLLVVAFAVAVRAFARLPSRT